MKSTPKNKLKYGHTKLDEDEFSVEHTKVRITTMLDYDILQKLKEEAQHRGLKYQTFLNLFLRENLLGNHSLENRLEKLEKAVFKKAR